MSNANLTALTNLSSGAVATLNALLHSSAGNGHDFGFMDEAREQTPFNQHSFAGYISHLTEIGVFDWTEDLSRDSGVYGDDFQFKLEDWVIEQFAAVAEAADKGTPLKTETVTEEPEITTAWTKTINAASGTIVITEFSNAVVHVEQSGDLKVSEASLTAAHKHSANKVTGFSGNDLALIRKFITLRIRG